MERIKTTENEKIALSATNLNGKIINMSEHNLDNILHQETINKFNNEVDKYMEEMKEHNKALEEISKNIGSNPEKLEIKPMFDHILIKPYTQNPFQKIQREGSIITDVGGFKVNVDMNPVTGKMEEQEQVILTGCVMEVGHTVKYLKVGDVVFYHRRNAIPIPFFKQGFYDLGEYHVLAVVNEELTNRSNNIK